MQKSSMPINRALKSIIVNLLENGLVSSEVFAGSGECRALKEADFQVGLLYTRTHGYATRGERVYGETPGTRFGRTSVVGAINQNNEFFAGFAFKGYMNSDLFCGWIEQIYAPSLKNPEKSVLFIDNASHHPKDRVFDIAEEYGFTVIFLPKYSPDYNKIEKYWANIKN